MFALEQRRDRRGRPGDALPAEIRREKTIARGWRAGLSRTLRRLRKLREA
jgi:hypothetical protein